MGHKALRQSPAFYIKILNCYYAIKERNTFHCYSDIINAHNAQNEILHTVEMTAYLATLNLNLLSHAFNILWQGQKIEQWQWRFFIIHISDSSLEQKCLIKRVRTWLIASCFPAHSYPTRSFQVTGGDVPRLSCVHPSICEWITYSQHTDEQVITSRCRCLSKTQLW